MSSMSLVFAAALASLLHVAASLSCNVGASAIHTGGCADQTDTNTIASITCPTGDSCTTYAYRADVWDCVQTTVVASCSAADACTGFQTQWGHTNNFECSSCQTDNCNPTSHSTPLTTTTNSTLSVSGTMHTAAASAKVMALVAAFGASMAMSKL
eukprot:CAMPEP_0178406012 /NCGR_PEP_ID=MMETSP0689_2-20121128/18694_1 /TAXON_ID=160604 /ORGANISM="Amphidinium massartii, Strain CS-259" /LENGTH=154 /DNA_ID=CAMNT_0020027043 /DNA_START=174 /DNA_END=638 /DNA_ORIENTATION=+